MKEWTVYVIGNTSGVLYTGIAKGDVARRITEHNEGRGAKFTKGRGPWEIVHSEGPMDHGDALRRHAHRAVGDDPGFPHGFP